MDRMITRSYRDEDAAALAGLFVEMGVAAGADPGFSEEEVRTWFASGLIHDAATDTRLVHTASGQLAAAALVSTPPEGGCRVDAFGGVLPAWRGRGIGRELFSWQIDRAEQLHAATAPDAPWQIDADGYGSEEATFRLFERFGLTVVRYWFEMAMSLRDPPKLPIPEGLRTVPFTTELAEPLYAAHVEAFADHFNYEPRAFESWTELSIRSGQFRADLSRIALDGDDIASYVLGFDEPGERVSVGLVGTRRPWRRRGLAGGLISEVLVAAAADGKTTATIGVDAQSPTGAVGVYERLGFHVVSSDTSYRRSLPTRANQD